jgi:hypothetical protein
VTAALLYMRTLLLPCLPQNFLGGVDEEWFRLVHVSIEAAAGPAMARLEALQEAARKVGRRVPGPRQR